MTGSAKHAIPQITKVCFTTNGYVDALAELAEQDRLHKVEYFGGEEDDDLECGESIRFGSQRDSLGSEDG